MKKTKSGLEKYQGNLFKTPNIISKVVEKYFWNEKFNHFRKMACLKREQLQIQFIHYYILFHYIIIYNEY